MPNRPPTENAVPDFSPDSAARFVPMPAEHCAPFPKARRALLSGSRSSYRPEFLLETLAGPKASRTESTQTQKYRNDGLPPFPAPAPATYIPPFPIRDLVVRFRNQVKVLTKVKSLSPNHRIVIALYSPGGVVETGLPMCPPEKRVRKLACGVQWDSFSSPV